MLLMKFPHVPGATIGGTTMNKSPVVLGGIVRARDEGNSFRVRCRSQDAPVIKKLIAHLLEEHGYTIHLERGYYD